MGLALECARCHDHKYDPISQKEYYQLFSYFQNISESGLYSYFTSAVPTPTMRVMDDSKKAKYKDLRQKVEHVQDAVVTGVSERIEGWVRANPKGEIKGQNLYQDFQEKIKIELYPLFLKLQLYLIQFLI